MHDNETNKINSEAVFQFYSLDTLAKDIQKVIDANINLINFATRPTSVKEVIKAGFDIDFDNKPTPNAPFTICTQICWNFGEYGTLYSIKKSCFTKVKEFVQRTRLNMKLSISNIAWEPSEDKEVFEPIQKYGWRNRISSSKTF